MFRISFFLGVFLLALLHSQVLHGQQTVLIEGMVTNPAEAPVAGHLLELYDAEGALLQSVTTSGSGSFQFSVSWTALPVEAGELPERLAIESVWPNPSTDAVSARFTVADPGSYRVEVFNLLGQLVSATQLPLQPGSGVMHIPRIGADGIYLLRISGAGALSTAKITLVGGSATAAFNPAPQLSSFSPAQAVQQPAGGGPYLNRGGNGNDIGNDLAGETAFRIHSPETPLYEAAERLLPPPGPGQDLITANLALTDKLFTWQLNAEISSSAGGAPLSGTFYKDLDGEGFTEIGSFEDGTFTYEGSLPQRIAQTIEQVSFGALAADHSFGNLTLPLTETMTAGLVLDATLSEYTFAGVVSNADAQPVAGTEILLLGPEDEPLDAGLTDASGGYSLSALSLSDAFLIRIPETELYETKQTEVTGQPGQTVPLDFTLTDKLFTWQLSATILSSFEEAPLSGTFFKDFGGQGFTEIGTFEDGAFSYESSLPLREAQTLEQVSFGAAAANHETGSLTVPFAGEMNADFILERIPDSFTFSGTVSNADEAPVGGIEVTLLDATGEPLDSALSNEAGSYSLSAVSLTSAFTIRTTETDFYEAEETEVSGLVGQTVTVNFTLTDKLFAWQLSGTVSSSLDASPVDGNLYKSLDGTEFIFATLIEGGQISYEAQTPLRITEFIEEAAFRIEAGDHEPKTITLMFDALMDAGEITLQSFFENYSFSGSLLNIDGVGVDGMEVRLKDSGMNVLDSFISDGSGSFSLSAVSDSDEFYLKAAGSDLYEPLLVGVSGVPGSVVVSDLTLSDIISNAQITGNIFNQRNQGVSGANLVSEFGSASSNGSGGYTLNLEFPARLAGQEFEVLAQREGYNSSVLSGVLDSYSFDFGLDKVLKNNSFVLDFTDVNGDLLESGTSVRLSYLNESGSDSVFVDVTPGLGERLSEVNFSNWPGEDFVISREYGSYLDTIIGRFDGQKFYEFNMFQNKFPDQPVVVPQSVINQEGYARVFLIPDTGSRRVVIGGEPVDQYVDMAWLLDETVRATGPQGSVKPFSPAHYGVSLPGGADWEVAIPAFAWGANGIVPGPGKVQEVYDIASDIYSSYTLNDGTQIFNPVINIYETPDDPGWQAIENRGLSNTHIINRSSNFIPGNQKVYVNISDSWYLRAGRSLFNNNATNREIIEELFEAITASDEPSNNIRYYISATDDGQDTYFNPLGGTIARVLMLSNPQTFYLPLNSNSSTNSLGYYDFNLNLEE